ncbi:MAG: hypothetical protein IH619_01185 [Ignavibacterium sp.]|nr:hypothetical protein [Ignavibacterium sp.]
MSDSEIIFFYSHYNPDSLRTKIVLSKALSKIASSLKLNFRSVDVLNEPQLCEKYCVGGVPTTLIVNNNNIVTKLLGEFDENEILLLLKQTEKKLRSK